MSEMGYSKDVSVQVSSYELQKGYVDNSSKFYTCTKRTIDILVSIVGIILTLPIYLILWICYQFGINKGPLIFKQKRVGKNGELFYIYKFRSMILDADKRLKANKVLYQKYVKNNYKLEPDEDPRITKLGSFLRKTSLDELPQLINVLQGKMTLVGPRPVVEEELMEYGSKVDQFLSVKPGVTGYWQVSGRSSVGYPERVDLELYYVENKSLTFDLKILFKTVIMVLIKKGAY